MRPSRVTIKIEFESTESDENTSYFGEICFDDPKSLNNAFGGTKTLGQVLRNMCQNVKDLVIPAMESAWRDL